MDTTKQTDGTALSAEREDIPAVSAEELRALPESELGRHVLRALSSAVATAAACELLSRNAFPPTNARVPLAAELTAQQRLVAEVTARREGLDLSPFAVPRARITRARWLGLGLEPPGVLEKMVTADLDGQTVSLPLWSARRALRLPWGAASLLRWLSRRELLEAYAEVLLHGGYDAPNVFDHQEVWALIDEQAADFVPAAEAIAKEAKRLWDSADPNAHAERGHWTSPRANDLLSLVMLYPLALAGRTLGPAEAVFVPFQLAWVGERSLGRTILLALRDDLREATVLQAYEEKPTLTAVQLALEVLRFLPLPSLARRAARDFYDPALKKSLPKIPLERLVGKVAAFCEEVPAMADFFVKPRASSKKSPSKK